ncbi:alpha/beta hydrolase [Azospirillum sp.]|uniref:alpha/beta fold hydrolase n=1 Tax=Azospirillum sp. TaxID=34012 RepID=UPI002D398F6E|nr:alpha/beta hydrolase [Azospirillum sp.]HYD69799.1 alpha/beta hydrolase [Azospirillum sp.]
MPLRDGRIDAGGFLDVAGARLEYRWIAPAAAGRPALVFLHEGLGCVALWKDFPDRVAAATGCGALVYSRAGYGRSSPVPVPRPLRYMHDEGLEVLPALLDQLDLRNVVLVGHSDGASIALIHAGNDRAGRLSGAVVMAPHVFCEDVSVASIARAANAYRDGDLRAKLQRLHGDNVDCAFWGWNRAWLDKDFRAWTIEEHLPGIRVPLLVIQGTGDEYGTPAQVEAIRAQTGGPVEVLMLDRCGHSPHRDQPEATLAAVMHFIAGRS